MCLVPVETEQWLVRCATCPCRGRTGRGVPAPTARPGVAAMQSSPAAERRRAERRAAWLAEWDTLLNP